MKYVRKGGHGGARKNAGGAKRGVAFSRKAEHRTNAQRMRDLFYSGHRLWIVQQMRISKEEIEWRVLLLSGPDTRSLTGVILGDPRYERSALYEKRRGQLEGVQCNQSSTSPPATAEPQALTGAR